MNTLSYDLQELSTRQVLLSFVPVTQYHLRVVLPDDSETIFSFDGYTRTGRDGYSEAYLSRMHLDGAEITEAELEDLYPGLCLTVQDWLIEDARQAREERSFRWALSEALDK